MRVRVLDPGYSTGQWRPSSTEKTQSTPRSPSQSSSVAAHTYSSCGMAIRTASASAIQSSDERQRSNGSSQRMQSTE